MSDAKRAINVKLMKTCFFLILARFLVPPLYCKTSFKFVIYFKTFTDIIALIYLITMERIFYLKTGQDKDRTGHEKGQDRLLVLRLAL